MHSRINDEYFEWLYDLVCGRRFAKEISYRKLLTYLHDTEFTYQIRRDRNRACDGIDLRCRFASLTETRDYSYETILSDLNGPCSILEMMIALAIRCEETIMDDANIGDRTGQWFWGMVGNLGLGSMMDARFDKKLVEETVARFLDREYEPDGHGGLFTIRNCEVDLRDVEIWYQLCWYLDTIT